VSLRVMPCSRSAVLTRLTSLLIVLAAACGVASSTLTMKSSTYCRTRAMFVNRVTGARYASRMSLATGHPATRPLTGRCSAPAAESTRILRPSVQVPN